MKVIFIKDVKGHGKKGDIKEVKDGFGQNFLINNGYAVMQTETSLKILNKENANKKEKEATELKEANALKSKLDNIKITFKVKTGENDRIFGSISTKQIASEMAKLGYNIEKNKIHLDHALSSLGIHNVDLELHKHVIATFKVELVKE